MSVLGPRPHAAAHNEHYRKLVPGYMLRHKAKPGIIGWAQVNGWRGETDTVDKMQHRVEHDLQYIRNWSLGLDLKIVALTAARELWGRRAY
jgi:putative colanic acid biosynthesis UDP-glucose lipid carrier transferase